MVFQVLQVRCYSVSLRLEHAPNMEALLTAGEKFAGHTALHLAAGAGHAELCGVLLESETQEIFIYFHALGVHTHLFLRLFEHF